VERFKSGPVPIRMVVQLAAKGDPIVDASQAWPEQRPRVELGTLSLTGRVADSDIQHRSLGFNPTRLVDGIEASDDQRHEENIPAPALPRSKAQRFTIDAKLTGSKLALATKNRCKELVYLE
jgi:catalase